MAQPNGVTVQQKKNAVESPDDIVIAGMSIRCAQSDNVEEFAENLYGGVNMVHENLQRCDEDHFGVPKQHGFIKDIRKFDATFFNVHPKQAEGMDPQLRILHEVAYESIIDGGVDPAELKNSNTGVFIGTSNSDAREAWTSADVSEIDGYSLIGTHRAFLANRLSFTFDLRGPSFGVDAACATSGVAINQGYLHIKHGVCDAALVGGVSLVYQPKVSYQILKLGLLCKDGMCKVFDKSADGYVRAEAIVCLLLQKRKNAKRIYATLVHSKINNDGFKEQGITFPCTESQGQLVAEVYAEAGVDPEDVEYVEAHGTGTTIGDPQETNGIALGFAGTRKKPLPIGAVKSNMGHTEHASGGVSVVKILIAMNTGIIPPNLHYKTPNPLIPALVDGRLKVVTEPMKWNSTLAGVNCFGFGGQNTHLILRGNPNVRKESISDLRLFVYMGRTEEAARKALVYVNRYPDNPYVPYLLMESAFAKPASMPYRGYTIMNGKQPISVVDRVAVEQKPVWWIFSGQGTQWASMGKDMMTLPAFAAVVEKCAETLKPLGLDLIHILTKGQDEDFNNPTISFVGCTAIQIALVELLRTMEISPQGFVGHSAGEIGCAYADGCFSIEEAMLTAYWRGRAVKEAQLVPGAMAALGLSWEKAAALCGKYSGVSPACDNADDNVTVSGDAAEVTRLVADLKPQNTIFAKEVNSYGVAFHSPAMQKAAPIYLNALRKVLPSPKMRTPRWLSTAVDEDQWTSDLAKYASAEYFAHNLSSTVKFNTALKKVPANSIVIEIAPHGLLQALIRKTVGDRAASVALMKRGVPDNAIHFLEAIGKLYVLGLNPHVSNISPKPSLPAPRDTPFLGAIMQWDHSASWRIPAFTDFIHKGGKNAQHSSVCDLSDPLNQYFLDNVVAGHPQFSVGGLLALVAKAYAADTGNTVEKCPRLMFSDLQFLASVVLDKDKKLQFGISVARKTGYFEITTESDTVATGFVSALPTNTAYLGASKSDTTSDKSAGAWLDSHSIYEEFQFRGYGYGVQCHLLKAVTADGTTAQMQCPSYETAIDGLLQLVALNHSGRGLVVPRRVRSIKVDMPITAAEIRKSGGCEARIVADLDLALTVGLEIEGVTWDQKEVELNSGNGGGLHEILFVPFEGKLAQTGLSVAPLVELAIENSTSSDVRIVELIKGQQAASLAQTIQTCQRPAQTKLQFNSFLLRADQDTEIEQGSATLLILQNYFGQAPNLEQDLQAVSSLIQDEGFLLIGQHQAQTSLAFQQALSAAGFKTLSELSDAVGNCFILARKLSDNNQISEKSQGTVVVLSSTELRADDENIKRMHAAAAEAHAKANGSARAWIIAPRHRIDLANAVIQLSKEYPDAGLRLVVDDSSDQKGLPAFDANSPSYADVVSRDLVVNIHQNGHWGTYRSLPVQATLEQSQQNHVVQSSLVSIQSSYVQASYALLGLAKAHSGQTALIISDMENSELADVIQVADKVGLAVHVIGSLNQKNPSFLSSLRVKNLHTYDGSSSDISTAQKLLKATGGRGIDIVYNLTDTSKLRESLRVIAPSGASYIEGIATELDGSCLSWAVSKNVKIHLLYATNESEMLNNKTVAEFVAQNFKHTASSTMEKKNGQHRTPTLLQSEKNYLVLAGNNENLGVKLAYWLAQQGADSIHLHLTSQPSAVLQSQEKFFAQLQARLTVWPLASAPDNSAEHVISTLSAQDGGLSGIFAFQSLQYGDQGRSSAQTTPTSSISIEQLDKLLRVSQKGKLDHFVVLTSPKDTGSGQSDSSATVKQTICSRISAGLPALLLELPTLVSSPESATTHSGSHPNENFVSLQQALGSLRTALQKGGNGVFVVIPEGKTTVTESASSFDDEAGPQDKSYLPQAVAKIMGIKDFASLDMFLSLGDYGIDSLMAMELGRILERDFSLSLTLQEIRSLCIRDICLMSGATNAVEAAKLSDVRSEFEKPVLLDTVNKHYNLGELVPKSPLVLLRQVQDVPDILFIVHPMEGSVLPVLGTLANHLQVTTYGLNCTNDVDTKSIAALAASYIQEMKKVQPTGPYNVGGYSFGAGVAFEMALQLEKEAAGTVQNLILLDGSHSFVATFTKSMKSGYTVNPNMPPEEMEARKQSAFETAILTLFVTQLVKTKRKQLTDALSAANTFDDRVDVAVKELQRCSDLQHLDKNTLRQATVSFAQRLKIADVYKPESKYTGRTTLVKCSEKMMRNLGEYYELDKVVENKNLILAVTVPGNHEGFVLGESARLTAKHVNEALLQSARS